MTIRNINSIKNVALAVAALAMAAPMAHSQTRVYNATTGKYTTTTNSRIVSGVNTANVTRYNGFYGNNSLGYLNNYSPYIMGTDPYIYGPSFPYRQNGAIVLGSDGQIYDTTANNGNGGVIDPSGSDNQNGMSNAAPAQLSDQIEARRLSGNRLRIRWSGDPRPVASMSFSLLDSRRNELRTAVVNDLPAEAIFTRPSTAAYYRVVITYGDGAVRSIVSPAVIGSDDPVAFR